MKRLFIISLFLVLCSFLTMAQSDPKAVKVFPNPAVNVINVLGLKNDRNAAISITDAYGTQVIFHQWEIKNNALNIPILNLEKGIYLITIQSEHQKVQTKFFKQ